MNRDEERLKLMYCISKLQSDAMHTMMKDRSEAYYYGAEILGDYLKYLNFKDR